MSREDKIRTVLEYYDRLDAEPGIGGAIASRFLALTRPDVAVSYNGKSKEYFFSMSGKGKIENNDRKGYEKALRDVYNQSWYKSPEPKNQGENEKRIWQNRAVLIDIIAFGTFSSDKSSKKQK